ncbi:hypothetical protein RRG08_061585 [Elysia crispata]|uniref:Uncharacterized protein n=1 Tax=Elysia crispata TaxID=231223 RepID=A0AAE1D4I8_9GAST|nr:hypothetical protein RRG08_061585 [Elysia crispata]
MLYSSYSPALTKLFIISFSYSTCFIQLSEIKEKKLLVTPRKFPESLGFPRKDNHAGPLIARPVSSQQTATYVCPPLSFLATHKAVTDRSANQEPLSPVGLRSIKANQSKPSRQATRHPGKPPIKPRP